MFARKMDSSFRLRAGRVESNHLSGKIRRESAARPGHFFPAPGEAFLEVRFHAGIAPLGFASAILDALLRHEMLNATRGFPESVQHHDAAISDLSERRIDKLALFTHLKSAFAGFRPVARSSL